MAEYTIEQLEDLTGFARRTIRYYIQQGLVEAPFGARKTPRYTERHVEQLLLIRKYKEAGLNLSRIASLLQTQGVLGEHLPHADASSEPSSKPSSQPSSKHSPQGNAAGDISFVSRIHIADGVSLDVDSARCNLTQHQLRDLANSIVSQLQQQLNPQEQQGPQGATNE